METYKSLNSQSHLNSLYFSLMLEISQNLTLDYTLEHSDKNNMIAVQNTIEEL